MPRLFRTVFTFIVSYNYSVMCIQERVENTVIRHLFECTVHIVFERIVIMFDTFFNLLYYAPALVRKRVYLFAHLRNRIRLR